MDFNHDGRLDILSGSWPGEIFLFAGQKEGTFAAPEMLKDKDGKYINIGGGVQDGYEEGILIAGNATFETTEEGTFVDYQGERYESTPERPVAITGTASAVHATDWDGDGDYDLLVGDIRGHVYLVENEGTPERHSFAKEQELLADGDPIRVGGRAGPVAADWDGDGDLDLLAGDGDGSVLYFRNMGSTETPVLAMPTQLVPPGSATFSSEAPKEVQRGVNSKICVVDWNGDGLLDLLVGDVATQSPDRPEPTQEEKKRHAEIRKEVDALRERIRELRERTRGPERTTDEEEYEKLRDELGDAFQRMSELRSQLPPEYETHGWVWLFLRKE